MNVHLNFSYQLSNRHRKCVTTRGTVTVTITEVGQDWSFSEFDYFSDEENWDSANQMSHWSSKFHRPAASWTVAAEPTNFKNNVASLSQNYVSKAMIGQLASTAKQRLTKHKKERNSNQEFSKFLQKMSKDNVMQLYHAAFVCPRCRICSDSINNSAQVFTVSYATLMEPFEAETNESFLF